MITVNFRVSSEGLIKGMSLKGHSGYADSGNDIICASASTLLYTAIGSLEELCGLTDFYRLSETSRRSNLPEARVTIPDQELQKGSEGPTQWIMMSIRKGFLLLEKADRDDYGGNHIKVMQQQG